MGEFIIKYWLQVIFTGILGVLTWGLKKTTNKFEKEIIKYEAIELGMQAMLRDRLIQSYNFHMEQGFCRIHDRDNIQNMYKQYHNLGANGVIDGLVNELMRLPVQERRQ